ncbi:MAG: hypothetical protein IT444_05855 [Phycisphaeraceae bacterium]|nr:hypothetical protein [Phycisphaeraceae bacterium]
MATPTRHSSHRPVRAERRLFHKPGLIHFWVLNDDCTDEVMNKMMHAFAKSDAAAVCLHPRCGLRVPYGGADWFDLIRKTTERCAKLGLQVWLYDEDPYPSGACGGRVFIERPEFEARAIERFEFNPAESKGDNLFYFPTGNLLWCGLVNTKTGETTDWTERVGTVRRNWKILDKWDSRFYYPATPLYSHPRSWAETPEYAVSFGPVPKPAAASPTLPPDTKLVAFVARPCGRGAIYGGLPDSLNPEATKYFIQLTHQKYKEVLGDMLGKEVPAIFTDEPKWYAHKPWTMGMFEDFERQFGYDLRPRLELLFNNSSDDQAVLTRLQYRQWCTERFEKSWLKPIADWCNRNNLVLTGHISPEDDPVEQSGYTGNLHYYWRHFGLAGIDLIIPAVGDHNHTLINVGIVSAVSAASQHKLSGVMSESLGASGLHPDMKQSGKVLLWQTMMGLTSPVIHYCQNSIEGLREYDAPPDFGPFSPHWPAMVKIHREVAAIQPYVRDATQVAPVALLWNVRSWWMQDVDWQTEPTGMRSDFNALLAGCLDRQVGTQIIDEIVLWDAEVSRGEIVIGYSRYSHLVVPSCSILHEKTIAKLRAAQRAGVEVFFAGRTLPTIQQTESAIKPLDLGWLPQHDIDAAVHLLPRLINLEGDLTDIRCTAWVKGGKTTYLLMNLRESPWRGRLKGKPITLAAGKVVVR